MNRRIVLSVILIFIAFSSFTQVRPNVIFILTDDQGWGDLSLHGNVSLETPNLDKLAKSGVQFKHCYVSPLCAPSRASMLTGRYHLSTGVLSVSKGLETMNSDETTIAELLKANGYKTGIFGKWHNGNHYPNRPNDNGFDEFFGFSAGHLSNYFNTELIHNFNTVKTKGYIADVLTNAALKFIDKNKSQPFFCYIPFNTPHSPYQVPDKFFNKYKAKGYDDELASVYGMIDNIDMNIGKIISHLLKNGLLENTIIIFMTDNGPNGKRFNGAMRGIKGSVHEGGVRVPFFMSWQNHIPMNKTIEMPVAHIDIYPTIVEICKLKSIPTKPLDGIGLSKVIFGDKESLIEDRNIFTHVNFMSVPADINGGGFRNNRFRFVFENNKSHLYDLKNDPSEQNDLSSNYPELTANYFNTYKKWFESSCMGIHYNKSILLSNKGVDLPTFEGNLSEGLKFKEGHGWANDWVAKWNSTNDSIYWVLDCVLPGNYLIEMKYLCKKENIGSKISCTVGNESRIAQIKEAFYSAPIPSPDRVPRKEVYDMKAWKYMKIGKFKIESGKQILKLKAIEIEKNQVAELYGLQLTYLD
jgi:arylsulfatase A-like enzyme